MLLNHPNIQNVRVTEFSKSRFRPVKVLIVQTDLMLPGIGEPCHDERLDDVLEYLEALKEEAHSFFGGFDSIEIRGIDEDQDNISVLADAASVKKEQNAAMVH